jgi:hypothetical protein
MDLSEPRVWKEGAEVVLNNLHIVAPLVAVTAAATWWFRGWVVKGTIDTLRERLQLADDSSRRLTRTDDELATQVRSLIVQLRAGSSKEALETAVERIGSTIAEISIANAELSNALKSRASDQSGTNSLIGAKEYAAGTPPNLTYTKVLSAEIGGKILDKGVTTWNGLLNEAIVQAAAKLKDLDTLKELIIVNSVVGKKEDQGYRYNASAGVSVQGQDANSAWKAISHMVKRVHLPVKVVFVWYDNEKAAYPGQTGKLTLKVD